MIDTDDGFAGYDYEELLDKWGLREEDTRLGNALYEMMELGVMHDWAEKQDDVSISLITRHIADNVTYDDNGDCSLDDDVFEDMCDFLMSLQENQYGGDGVKTACGMLLNLALDNDKHDFVSWFCYCLKNLWV